MRKICILSLLLCLGLGLFAQIQSKVTKTLTPINSTIPVVYQANVQGGLHQVANQTERDAMPVNMKVDGMLVWVTADNAFYRWNETASSWGKVSLIKTWVTDATYAVDDIFLYNTMIVRAKTAGTIAAGTNPVTDNTNWNIIGDDLGVTTDNNSVATYVAPVATVDSYSGLVLKQTLVAATATLSTPTNVTVGKRFTLVNAANSTYPVTVGTYSILAGQSAQFVWNGSSWSSPSSVASNVAISGLTAATAANTIANGDFAQDWKWNSSSTTNPLSIGSSSLTTGNLLSLNGSSASQTGNTLLVSSNATAPTNGVARFNLTAAHTGNGVQIDDITTTGNVLAINASNVNVGNAMLINANAATGGTGLSINANALTTGSGLKISSSSTTNASFTGLLYVVNKSNRTTGTIARIESSSAAGSGLTVLANGNTGFGTNYPDATLHNAGSTILGTTTDVNSTATYAPTAAATVDNFSGLVLTQTITATAVTLAAPAKTAAGRRFTLTNSVNSTYPLTVGTYSIPVGQSAEFVWNGSAWSAPSSAASSVALSGLTGATAANTVNNGDYAQTWNWNSSNATNPLSIGSNSLTTGNLLSLNGTSATHTGNVLLLSSNATAPINGVARFNITGAHTGTGVQVDDATTAGTALAINANSLVGGTALNVGSTATATTGSLLSVSSGSTSGFTNGGVYMNFTGAHTGTAVRIDDVTTTGNPFAINANYLSTGYAMKIISNSTALQGGGALMFLASSGANASSGVSTTNAIISNTRTGATSTNIGLSLTASGATNNYALVVPSGYVGIGNSAPTVALDVTGDAKVSGVLSTPSDIRLKTKVETLTDVLTKLEQLRGVTYEFKDQVKYAKGPQVGVIAQELQKVFPELVILGSDGYLSVNYTQLTGVLVQAIKEQQAEINTLKDQMKRVMDKLEMK